MKKTLLQMVQEILAALDSDEVNSYADSTESLQVASIIENTYWDIVSQSSFPKLHTPFELTSSGNPSHPNLMTLPEDYLTIAWIKYDQSTTDNADAGYFDVQYVDQGEFLRMMYSMDSTDTNVTAYEYTLSSGDTMNIRCYNDRPPNYYTSLDDNLLIFNSFDATQGSTLQADKSLAYGEKKPTWTMNDSFVPDLPDKQFTILRNEAKATAFAELKQTTNTNAERKARRGWVTSQKTSRKINNPRNELDRTPNYAR